MRLVLAMLALGLAGSPANAEICPKSGEKESGMNKVCSYQCAGRTVTVTIGVLDTCPETVER